MKRFLSTMICLMLFLTLILCGCGETSQVDRDKELKEMQQSLQVGDEIVTGGGIVGIVFSIKDDTVVIETGGDRSKIRIKKWAIAKVESTHED